MPADELATRFRERALAQPRVQLVESGRDGRSFELVARSRVFRFPDRISVEAVPLDGNRSTLMVFSRSRYGYRDFGVNKHRIDAWLATLSPGPAGPSQSEASPRNA